jgi:hypothetical protein
LWVLRSSLATPQSIATLVKSAREHGFNTLLVQVRGRGDAYYLGGVEPRASELLRQPDNFDPLETVLDAGHAAGLRIHAWVNVNLVSSATELPSAREHLIYRHPSWLMVPRDIGQQLAAIDSESPGYVGTLARWTRTRSAEIEGLYVSPIVPEAAEYTDSIVRDLVRATRRRRTDYARYPSDRFDYSRGPFASFAPRSGARCRTPLDGLGCTGARRPLRLPRRVAGPVAQFPSRADDRACRPPARDRQARAAWCAGQHRGGA